jgi:hypothetical protein
MEAMRPFELLQRRTPRRRQRLGISNEASNVLGVAVRAVVPVQRQDPRLMLAVSLAELMAAVALVVTVSLAALAALAVLSVLLVALSATNRHQVLAFTAQGHVALAASARGVPRTVVGPLPRRLALPEPAGIGQPIEMGGATWWVDRSAFKFLRHARKLLEADGEDDGGEGEHDRRQDGDAVQVALDHGGSGGRRAEAPAEHLREAAPSPAVQQDQHDQGA